MDPQKKEEEMWEILMSNPDKIGNLLKMYGNVVQKQGKKLDAKSIHLSGELNSLTV